jgi:hypothetical protein
MKKGTCRRWASGLLLVCGSCASAGAAESAADAAEMQNLLQVLEQQTEIAT